MAQTQAALEMMIIFDTWVPKEDILVLDRTSGGLQIRYAEFYAVV